MWEPPANVGEVKLTVWLVPDGSGLYAGDPFKSDPGTILRLYRAIVAPAGPVHVKLVDEPRLKDEPLAGAEIEGALGGVSAIYRREVESPPHPAALPARTSQVYSPSDHPDVD